MGPDLDGIDVDETLKVDTLCAAESALLHRLQERSAEIEALCARFAALRGPGADFVQLRSAVDEAARVQESLGIPADLLQRGALLRAGVPVDELERARRVVDLVTACDEAAALGREQAAAAAAAAAAGRPSGAAAVEALERVLVAWGDLQRHSARTRLDPQPSAADGVDLGVDRRRGALRPVVEDLLRAASDASQRLGVHQDGMMGGHNLLGERLSNLLAQGWAAQALDDLGAHTAGVDRAGAGALTLGSVGGDDGTPSRSSSNAAPIFVPASPPALASASARAFGGSDGPSADASPRGARGGAGDSPEAASFTFASLRDAGVGVGQAPPSPGGSLPAGAAGGPAAPAPAPAPGPAPRPAPPRTPPASARPPPPALGAPPAIEQAPPLTCEGPAELWHAVHVGDEALVASLAQRGQCNGLMRDASNHSVLWHAISFGHLRLAAWVLETFPPGSRGGVELSEVHARRGDSLLHLLCQLRPFGAEAAGLFRSVAPRVPPALLDLANASGATFLRLAAASLNFWVLRFMCLHFPAPMKALVCCERHAPLRALAEGLPPPPQPSPARPEPLPAHFAVAQLLGRGREARAPFADVAFDVGPPGPGEGLASGQARFLAHRIVVGAQSAVLLQELEALPLQRLASEGVDACVFRVDARISKETWRCALQFLYTGVVQCGFATDAARLLELLRACVLYGLPSPLFDFVQCALFPLLATSPPPLALEAFQVLAGAPEAAAAASGPLLEAAAGAILRGAPAALGPLPPEDVVRVVELVVKTSEQAVFRHAQQQQQQQQQQQHSVVPPVPFR